MKDYSILCLIPLTVAAPLKLHALGAVKYYPYGYLGIEMPEVGLLVTPIA